MGFAQRLPARWGPTRAAVTLGVLLSLLVAQLVTIGAGTATASPFDFRGELTFRALTDQADPTANELSGDAHTVGFAVTEVSGNDVAIPGFHWLGDDGQPGAPQQGQGLFDLSCSRTIRGTFAIALEGNEVGFAAGTRLQITAFESTRAKDGRDRATCDGRTFVAPELEESASVAEVAPGGAVAGTLTVTNLVEGPTPTGVGGEQLPVTLVVACQQADAPGVEPDVSWTWIELLSLLDGESVDLEVADEADCWVEETDTLEAVRTTWRLDDDAEVEGVRTGQIRVVPDGSRTVTFTNTFAEATPTPAIALVTTAVAADVPFAIEDGTLVLDVTGQDDTTVTYDHLLTNVGEETLVGLTLDDDLIGDLSAALDGVQLAVGASISVTATYEIAPEQLTAPAITNVATVTGQGLVSAAEVTARDDETVLLVDVEAVGLTTPQEPASGPAVLGTQLPRTGVDAMVLTVGGLLLALLGVATVLAGRPRRRRTVS